MFLTSESPSNSPQSGQPVIASSHPYSKEIFSYVQTEFPVFHFVPTASCLFTGHHQEEYSCLSTPLFLLPSGGYMALLRSPAPSCLQAKPSQLFSASPHLSDASIS